MSRILAIICGLVAVLFGALAFSSDSSIAAAQTRWPAVAWFEERSELSGLTETKRTTESNSSRVQDRNDSVKNEEAGRVHLTTKTPPAEIGKAKQPLRNQPALAARATPARVSSPAPVASVKSTATSQMVSAPDSGVKESDPADDATGTIVVSSIPVGAAVFLDGANVGQTPLEADVPSGTHHLRILHPTDGTDKQQTVVVKPGVATKVEINY